MRKPASIHLTALPSRSRRDVLRLTLGGALAASLPGCALPERGPPVPIGRTVEATVLGVPNERFFPMKGIAPMEAEFVAALQRQVRARGLRTLADLPPLRPARHLGRRRERGLRRRAAQCGWTETRQPPDLLPGHRHQHRRAERALRLPRQRLRRAVEARLHRHHARRRILVQRVTAARWFDDALADNSPLFRTISRIRRRGACWPRSPAPMTRAGCC